MKTKFLLLFFTLVLVSCSSESEFESDNHLLPKASEQTELNSVYARIDSINTVYISQVSTRGFWGWLVSNEITTAADNVGRVAGSWVGRSAGSLVGSLTGNPVCTVLGYVGGRWVGGIAGSVAASYVASKVFNCTVVSDNLNTYSFEVSETMSVGEIHNSILLRLFQNEERYLNSDNTINYDVLLTDCARFAEEIDSTQYDSTSISSCMPLMVEQVRMIEKSAYEFEKGSSETIEDLYNIMYDNIVKVCPISREEYEQCMTIDLKLGATYASLDPESAKQCEREIDLTIESSKLNDDVKENLRSSNSVVANSAIIWNQLSK